MNPGQEIIKLYAKQLRLPTLAQIDDLIRQAEEQGLSYADFLGQVLQREIHQREENQQRLKIRKAKFPLDKSLDTFDLSRLTQVEDALIWQLATGEFVKHRENVIMIGNPGNGNYVKKVVMQSHEPESNARRSLTDSMTLHNETGSFTQVIEPGHQVFVVIPFRIPSMIV